MKVRRPRWHHVAWVATTLLLAAGPALAVPGYDEVRRSFVPSDLPLLDRHGTPIQTVRVDASVRRGAWLTLTEVSPALREALVLSEDRRFWAHGGVDWQALAASAWANAWNTRTRGASTLTMQLAGLLNEDLARPARGRSVAQKVTQMARAQQLESRWTKAQILEAYLNHVPLRGELVGVGAASQVLFGKFASGLDQTEAAVLAVMVRGPNANAATLERRACEVLRQQKLSCAPLAITITQALARRPGALRMEGSGGGEAIAPHLAQRIAQQGVPQQAATPGTQAPVLALRSTLDARVQRTALAALRRQLAELRGREVEDGAVLVLDNASGEVLAWVGSSGAGSAAAEVDAVLARRQPGSTLKPFVYGLALQQRLVTPASLIEDAPLQIHAGGALYTPQNYDHAYKGWVSVRTALASSLNVPAVRVGSMLGPEALFATLNDAGLQLTESAGYHGHALALGSADVTLLALTNAYRMLANGGRHSGVRWVPGGAAKPSRQVLDPAVAWQVADMLADPAARATTFGFDSPLVTRGWAAVKTGTSKDMRDNWCIGFTPRYTVGVWVGNASGAPMHQVSGVSGAAPVWREVMALLHAAQPALPPSPPAGLVARSGEWFLAGTEPMQDTLPAPATASAMAAFGIQSPRNGSVFLLDPDIPATAQQMVFAGAAGQWRINGRLLGSGKSLQWQPRPGRHVLERRDVGSPASAAPDRVVFEVRAAPPAAALRGGRAKGTTAPNV
ncbi:MAG: penicillin-binding protein 1C [Rubrivivax sp.]|nr:penicillin-binding protein 1C [Rubrivivax sp.]